MLVSNNWVSILMAKPLQKIVLPWLLFVGLLTCIFVVIKNKQPSPIYIEQHNLTQIQLAELHQVAQSFGDSQFYKTNLEDIAQGIEQISWVDAVHVYRDWNRGIVISASPKTAIANFGSEYLLDVSGVPFMPADKSELNNPKFTKLYGDHAHAKEIMQKMQKLNSWFAPLHMSVADIVLTPRQTWLIKFNNGLRVTVDHDRVDEKLFKLSDVLRQGSLPVELEDIATIDLRYKNGFSIGKKIP